MLYKYVLKFGSLIKIDYLNEKRVQKLVISGSSTTCRSLQPLLNYPYRNFISEIAPSAPPVGADAQTLANPSQIDSKFSVRLVCTCCPLRAVLLSQRDCSNLNTRCSQNIDRSL